MTQVYIFLAVLVGILILMTIQFKIRPIKSKEKFLL